MKIDTIRKMHLGVSVYYGVKAVFYLLTLFYVMLADIHPTIGEKEIAIFLLTITMVWCILMCSAGIWSHSRSGHIGAKFSKALKFDAVGKLIVNSFVLVLSMMMAGLMGGILIGDAVLSLVTEFVLIAILSYLSKLELGTP